MKWITINLKIIVICGVFAFIQSCSFGETSKADLTKEEVDTFVKGSKPSLSKALKKASKASRKQVAPDKYPELEDSTKDQTTDKSILMLMEIDPVKNSSDIIKLAEDLKQYGDASVRAVAEAFESTKSLKERVALIIALNVLNDDIAGRYISEVMKDMLPPRPESAGFAGVLLEALKKRSDAAINFEKLLKSSDDIEFRKKVIVALGEVGGNDASMVLFEAAMSDKVLADLIIESMSKIKSEENAEHLIALYINPDLAGRQALLLKAIQSQEDNAAKPLVDLLRRSSPENRMKVIALVANVGGKRSLEELGYYYRGYARDLKFDEKMEILRQVDREPDVARDVAEYALRDEDVSIKKVAIDMLRKHGGSRAIIVLQTFEQESGPLKEIVQQSIKELENRRN